MITQHKVSSVTIFVSRYRAASACVAFGVISRASPAMQKHNAQRSRGGHSLFGGDTYDQLNRVLFSVIFPSHGCKFLRKSLATGVKMANFP